MTSSSAPEMVGPYRLEKKLGSGGMGVVWLAHDTLLERPVALKMMRGLDDDADELRGRFLREARAAARIKSRHVVQVLQLGMTDSGTIYIVMEVLDGMSLLDVMERGPLPPGRAVHIARQITEAMQAAHDIGVIHRDLKPANVMVVREGDVEIAKVLDFGIARLANDKGPVLTQAGIVLGTVPYLSPEQIDGGVADERSDIYAFGMMLYRMLAGRPPWDVSDVGAMIHHHRSVAPPTVRQRALLPATIPPLLDAAVMRCLKKDPAERWPSMRELGTALGAAISTLSSTSTVATSTERATLDHSDATEDGSHLDASSIDIAIAARPLATALLTNTDDSDDDDGDTTINELREPSAATPMPTAPSSTTATAATVIVPRASIVAPANVDLVVEPVAPAPRRGAVIVVVLALVLAVVVTMLVMQRRPTSVPTTTLPTTTLPTTTTPTAPTTSTPPVSTPPPPVVTPATMAIPPAPTPAPAEPTPPTPTRTRPRAKPTTKPDSTPPKFQRVYTPETNAR